MTLQTGCRPAAAKRWGDGLNRPWRVRHSGTVKPICGAGHLDVTMTQINTSMNYAKIPAAVRIPPDARWTAFSGEGGVYTSPDAT
jgi:hypothetical protein